MIFDYIVGTHSIAEAIKNTERRTKKLYATKEGLAAIKAETKLTGVEVTEFELHPFQEHAKKIYQREGFEFHRVAGGALLEVGGRPIFNVDQFYKMVDLNTPIKILALDQVTDMHNAAAIVRTAAFYGIDVILVPQKNSFRLTPNFYRIASGGAEYVHVLCVSSLSSAITKLNERNVQTMALSEHATDSLPESASERLCIILGAEDQGISNAVMRVAQNTFAISPHGPIKSLNVSVASAVSMEIFWGKKNLLR